jgi:hypothetical protein
MVLSTILFTFIISVTNTRKKTRNVEEQEEERALIALHHYQHK